jgi:ketosteroid isomerase-like protein
MNMSSIAWSVIGTALAVVIGAPLISQERVPPSEPNTVTAETVFDPSRDDARIVAVLDAVRRRNEAMRTGDLVTVRKYMPPNMIVNAPINRVVDGRNVLTRLERGEIAYDEDGQSVIELAAVRDELVVLMGRGELKPVGNAPHAGKTIRRRFTDIWKRNAAGEWQNIIRQATIYAIE